MSLLDPMRWQLWPLALAVLALGVLWLRGGLPAWPWWVMLGALAGLSLALLAGFPSGPLPAPRGPHPVGTTEVELERSAPEGPRRLFVKLWYPAAGAKGRREGLWSDLRRLEEAPAPVRAVLAYLRHARTHSRIGAPAAGAGRPFPVIVYNHSFVSFASENTLLLEELASRGHVVLSVRHRDQAAEAGAGREPSPALAAAIIERRAADSRFVLDRLEAVTAGVPGGVAVAQKGRFGAIGLSLGGAVSTRLCLEDPRCAGAVNLDGAVPGADEAGRLGRPYLMVLSQDNAQRAGPAPRAVRYEALTPPGTRHVDFHDLTVIAPGLRWIGVLGPGGGRAMNRRVADAAAAFFRRVLPRG